MLKQANAMRWALIASSMLIAPCVAVAQEQTTEEQSDRLLEEIVVLGRFIPEPMQNTSEVAAFILSEDLARQGDANAALALTRVTGLSIAEGRFVYVRGLGERYSSALLNNSPLPSPEPLQRVVPLDLFPSSVLEQIQVQKTYSVEFPGEFGGGVISLGTLSIPREPFLEVGVGVSLNDATSLESGITHYGSDTDWFGFDTRREMPDLLQDAAARRLRVDGVNFTEAEVQQLGWSLENAPLTLLQRTDALPVNGSVDVTFGNKFTLGGLDAGVVGVVGFSNDWKKRDGVQQEGAVQNAPGGGTELVIQSDYDYEETQNEVGWDGMLAFGVDIDDNNSLQWTNLYVRRTTKNTYFRDGLALVRGFDRVRDERTAWYERQLFSTQVSGEHAIGALDLDWRVAYAETERDAPYEREIAYEFDPTVGLFATDGSRTSNKTSFSTLDDSTISAGVDGKYVIPLSASRDLDLSAGLSYVSNGREAVARDYRFVALDGLPYLNQFMRVDFFLSNFNIGPQRLSLREVTNEFGAYGGVLQIAAAYAKADWEIIPLVRTSFGLRVERGKQKVKIIDLFGGAPPATPPALEETYVLPAGTVTWNFAEDQQVRFGVSKTIGRPQFRELAQQSYLDPESDRIFTGNPYLVDTELLNFDARYERYFDRGEFVTGGVFYKEIDKPVEAVVQELGSAIQQSYLNAPKATLFGFEVEAKKVFAAPFPQFLPGQDVFVQANYTWTDSEVQAGQNDTVLTGTGSGIPVPARNFIIDGSRMQGQSEQVANLQLGLENKEDGSQGTLLVTYVSERSSARGRQGEPDIIQEPGVIVDFVYNKDLSLAGKPVSLKFRLGNILGTEFQEYQEDGGRRIDVNKYDLGRSVSIGLTRKY